MSNYIEPRAKTVSIKANSKCTVKIKDNFYSIEYSEERVIPDDIEVDLNRERTFLWDDVNSTVDMQIDDILKMFKK